MKNLVWLIAVIIFIGVMAYQNDRDTKQRQQEELTRQNKIAAEINAKFDEVDKNKDNPGLFNKLVVETAMAGLDYYQARSIAEVRYADKSVRQRALENIQNGYQFINPIRPRVIAILAVADCRRGTVNYVGKRRYSADVIEKVRAKAIAEVEIWLPYVENANAVRQDCYAQFDDLMPNDKGTTPEQKRTLTAKDVGTAVGKVTSGIGKLWEQKTKPISDAVNGVVDDFKTGYSDATE
ncbi:hypothetical protein [Ochrobactrum sp. CGA5]|uniref:hypothetical protein n=1 Tax=Ochrobactrum sp. CGA5 TaxID=2583453 RepID=UPI00111E1FF4|nr:hypothetical protein [Ochrobactrum sp. CGA5]